MKYAVLLVSLMFCGCAGMMEELKYSADQGKTFAQKEREWKKTREAYVAAHPDLDPTVRQAILDGRRMVGMTEEQAVATFGAPADKNFTTAEGVRTAQWIYKRGGQTYQYLYFTNGKLKVWQD